LLDALRSVIVTVWVKFKYHQQGATFIKTKINKSALNLLSGTKLRFYEKQSSLLFLLAIAAQLIVWCKSNVINGGSHLFFKQAIFICLLIFRERIIM